MLRAKVRFERKNPETGRPQRTTVETCGRDEEELNRRIERIIYTKTIKQGWKLR